MLFQSHAHYRAQNATFLGNGVFVGGAKIKIKMMLYWLKVTPSSSDWCLLFLSKCLLCLISHEERHLAQLEEEGIQQ